MDKVVIIPTYNEKENIKDLITKIIDIDKNIDILVVDGNSKDGTKQILETLEKKIKNLTVIYEERRQGFASAYIKGFRYALLKNYELILQMDADLQHNPSYIPKILDYSKYYDVVIASRDLSIKKLFTPIPNRIKLSILANIYINLVAGMKFSDTLSGYKCYKQKVLEIIDWKSIRSYGFIFQVETLYKISKQNYKIMQFPIVLLKRKLGHSKISFFTFIEGLFRIMQLRLK